MNYLYPSTVSHLYSSPTTTTTNEDNDHTERYANENDDPNANGMTQSNNNNKGDWKSYLSSWIPSSINPYASPKRKLEIQENEEPTTPNTPNIIESNFQLTPKTNASPFLQRKLLRRSGRRRSNDLKMFSFPLNSKITRCIFQWLDTSDFVSAMKVNSSWREYTLHTVPKLLLKLDFSKTKLSKCDPFNPDFLLMVKAMKRFLEGCPRLIEVSLCDSFNIVNAVINQLSKSNVHIKSLNLEGCNISSQQLAAIFETFKELECVNLVRTNIPNRDLCQLLQRYFPTEKSAPAKPLIRIIKEISLSSKIDNELAETLSRYAPYLQKIKLTDSEIGDEDLLKILGLSNGRRSSSPARGGAARPLTHLNLCCNFSDQTLISICHRYPHITFFSAPAPTSSSLVTSLGVNQLAFTCTSLTYLNLCQRAAIGDEALSSLAEFCTQLRYLDVRHCVKIRKGLSFILEKCKRLHTLLASGCSQVETLISPHQNNDSIKTEYSLTHLDITNCKRLGDDELSCISSFTNMGTLKLGDFCGNSLPNTSFSLHTIHTILSSCRSLQVLHIFLPKFDPVGLKYAFRVSCPVLKELYIYNQSTNMDTIFASDLCCIIEQCPVMKKMGLSESIQIGENVALEKRGVLIDWIP
eukprot:TRINITY_DN2528_c0_g2_i2.p1 TRINITY_DN2528_c0_g2~~TRINITY_DN2528_c0_g2_i2.p1  ORF type:complete len:637 (-),score=100.09 TRINITY_DN2528_c0_g2_i2:41-1951(-)